MPRHICLCGGIKTKCSYYNFCVQSSPIWKKAFEPLRKKLTLSSQLLLQWGVPVLCYFWISLNYSLVTLAFHVDMTRKYGYGGFPLFWA